MDSYWETERMRFQDRMFVWNRNFTERQRRAYQFEDKRLAPDHGQTIISAFLKEQSSRLDPLQYNYTALTNFLEAAGNVIWSNIPSSPHHNTPLALLDDRRDDTGWEDINGTQHSARNWDRYADYPPQGKSRNSGLFGPGELYRKQLRGRLVDGAERRILYVANMDSLCGLAIVSTASSLRAPVLRDFLQRYTSYRVFFGVSMSFGFALEFHLPYYALRQGSVRQIDPRGLRRCADFIPDRLSPDASEYLYEAQISVVVTGIDEWFWTAYCCTDTHFGSEESVQYYHENGLDAPTGGEKSTDYPIWNPREYFLVVLSCRVKQTTKEWGNVINTLETRLKYHEESIFNKLIRDTSLIDDVEYSRTREYTRTIELLRLLYNALVKVIESWESFESGEIRYFDVREQETLRKVCESYLASIEKDMTELRFLRRSLQQRIEMFDNMRNGLVNASAMAESRVATLQGKNIGRLTRVTVIYLPLSLGTAIFSMAIMPKGASWKAYAFVLVFLTAATLLMAFKIEFLKAMGISAWAKTVVITKKIL